MQKPLAHSKQYTCILSHASEQEMRRVVMRKHSPADILSKLAYQKPASPERLDSFWQIKEKLSNPR